MKSTHKELEHLRQLTVDAGESTKSLLDSIRFENPITILATVVINLGITYLRDNLIYWVIACFLITFLWSLSGLFQSQKTFDAKTVEQSMHFNETLAKPQKEQLADLFVLNISNYAKAMSIVYSLSLMILLGSWQGWFKPQIDVLIAPLITLWVYIPLPFLLRRIRTQLMEGMNSSFSAVKSAIASGGKVGLHSFTLLMKLVFGFMVFFGLMLAPAISLYQTLGLVNDYLLLMLVALLQYVSILMIASYYSSLTASMYLTNALSNYSNIVLQIDRLLLSGKIPEGILAEAKACYLKAKPYDLQFGYLMHYLPFYTLKPNTTYLQMVASDKK